MMTTSSASVNASAKGRQTSNNTDVTEITEITEITEATEETEETNKDSEVTTPDLCTPPPYPSTLG